MNVFRLRLLENHVKRQDFDSPNKVKTEVSPEGEGFKPIVETMKKKVQKYELTEIEFRTHNRTTFCPDKSRASHRKMTTTVNLISTAQKTKIKNLARQGCSIHEVGTALGFTQGQVALILEDENHPFNQTYWQEKVKYAQRLRSLAMKIAETSKDDSVRAKLLEFLTKENSDAFENKRQHTGYTNIRKLLSLVRQQFEQNSDGSTNRKVVRRNQNRLGKELAKSALGKEVADG
jgi:hypothetical protein